MCPCLLYVEDPYICGKLPRTHIRCWWSPQARWVLRGQIPSDSAWLMLSLVVSTRHEIIRDEMKSLRMLKIPSFFSSKTNIRWNETERLMYHFNVDVSKSWLTFHVCLQYSRSLGYTWIFFTNICRRSRPKLRGGISIDFLQDTQRLEDFTVTQARSCNGQIGYKSRKLDYFIRKCLFYKAHVNALSRFM